METSNVKSTAGRQHTSRVPFLGKKGAPAYETNLILLIYLAFPCRERDTATGFPNYSRPFVVEEVTVHNTGISLVLSTSVWVLLSPPIESRETRPTA